jgi:molybdenum cofactor guanylyltransferase
VQQLNNISIPLTGIVLAGGKSSRMGQDKALLPIGGVPLLKLVCDRAIALCNLVYVVTPWQERYQHLLPIGCQFVREISIVGEPNAPIIGFAQGLVQAQSDWVLLLACDLPRLQVEVLQQWASQLDTVREDAIALLPRHAKGWEPLCGFYRCDCLPGLTDFISQGGRSFQRWLEQHLVQEISVGDSQMLFNCNTPADVASLESEVIFKGDGLAMP